MSKKNPVGRPPLPKSMLKKRATKVIRVPLAVADLLKNIAILHKAGTLSTDDINNFIKSKEM